MIPIRTILNDAPSVTALLKGSDGVLRVYRDLASEGVQYPYAVWTLISGHAIDNVDIPAVDDSIEIQIDVYAQTEQDRDNVFKAVRNVLKHHSIINNFPNIGSGVPGIYRGTFTCGWLIEA
ncbi:DUF3168 domain-containing protein [Acinetobacter sp. 2JN-4]|uniref:tail completion protein gp17 n=1 Tax=Acinetobacter sp. 2JN-4 TaxID=2479844 RepID=UPI000EF9BD0F|nr:DUF3168 domain-containing protein [Acinetobacter sp. 2JN-4]RLZ06653.1 DUF3168 domain-containing protein [Acinetobacter sp. 2JN-4]